MKHFRLSCATTLVSVLAISFLLVMIIPGLRFAFGNYIWDTQVLVLYERLQIYKARLIIAAGLVFVATGYAFSRQQGMKYAFNGMVIEWMAFLMRLPGVEEFYLAIHTWYAGLYGAAIYPLLKRIPAVLQNSEFKNSRERISPPNRRYLTIVRARMDETIRQAEDQLLAQSFDHTVAPAVDMFWEQTAFRMKQDRLCWERHLSMGQTKPTSACEPGSGIVLILLEQWIFSCAYHRLTGREFPGSSELLVEINNRLPSIGFCPEMTPRFSKAAVSIFQAALMLDQTPLTLDNLLSSSRELLVSARLVSGQATAWAVGLTHTLLTLTMERLAGLGYWQETVQIVYQENLLLQAGRPSDAPAEARPARKTTLLDLLWTDIEPFDQYWAVLLAARGEDRWRYAVLLDAWLQILADVLVMFPVLSRAPEAGEMLPTPDREGYIKLCRIRQGYINFINDEVQAAAYMSYVNLTGKYAARIGGVIHATH